MVTAKKEPSLKDYLKKYQDGNEEGEKKLKKKKMKSKAENAGVIVVDEDPIWQKPVKLEEEEDDDFVDEKPQVDEDIEVKRMKRLEQARSKRPLGMLSEDGSGWVPISDTSKMANSDDQISDISPPRRRRLDTPLELEDLSPLRKQRAQNDSPSPEPMIKLDASAYSDLSPPRKHRVRDVSSSPQPEKMSSKRNVTDLSPPRRRARFDTPSPRANLEPSDSGREMDEISPLRQQQKRLSKRNASSTLDLSPPRKIQKKSHIPKQQPKTGLVTGQDIKEEITRTKRDNWLSFKEMDPSVSGRGAEPVYRDKLTGNRMSKDQFLKSQEKKEEKPKEIKLEWGKGLAQKREAEAKLEELEREKEKPFARSRDDPELDKMLKERLRWGDPMAHLVKKKQLEPVLPDLGDSEKMKESGFVIPQEIPSHSWIRRGIDFPSNRYGIKPGRHWDGVDRSNGYEKEHFKRMNEKQATQREAYLWSVSDM